MFIDDDPFFKLALLFVAFVAVIWVVWTVVDYLVGTKKNEN